MKDKLRRRVRVDEVVPEAEPERDKRWLWVIGGLGGAGALLFLVLVIALLGKNTDSREHLKATGMEARGEFGGVLGRIRTRSVARGEIASWNDAFLVGHVAVHLSAVWPATMVPAEGYRSKDPILQIAISVHNGAVEDGPGAIVLDPGALQYQPVRVFGWNYEVFGKPLLVDDRGNGYELRRFDAKAFFHVEENELLQPGRYVTDLLAFDPPPRNIKYVTLILPAANVGGKGDLRFRLLGSRVWQK